MGVQDIAYGFALCAGFVTSGLIASLWELFTGEPLDLTSLSKLSLLSPMRGLVYGLSMPSRLFFEGLTTTISRPSYSAFALMLGGGLGFLQGVVVMTQIFGIK